MLIVNMYIYIRLYIKLPYNEPILRHIKRFEFKVNIKMI